MFRLPSLTASTHRPLRPWHRVALFGAGLLVLWLALQLAPSAPATPPPPSRSADAAERLPSLDTSARPNAETAAPALATRPARGWLRPGNVIALLLLVGGGAWALHLRRRSDDADGVVPERALRALDTLALAPGQSLRLVAVGDEVLLLGVADGGVSLLCRYDAEDAPISSAASGAHVLAADFSELLHRAQGRSVSHA